MCEHRRKSVVVVSPNGDEFAVRVCMDCGAALSEPMEKFRARSCEGCGGEGGLLHEKGVKECIVCWGTGLMI